MQLSKVKRFRKKQRQRPLAALLEKNPVLVLGLDLPFIIVTSVSLKAAAAMSLELFIIHMGTVVAALATCRFLKDWMRPLANVAVSTLIMAFSRILVVALFRGATDSLGMYLYLMAVNGMTIVQCAAITGESKIYPVISSAFMNTLGFAAAMFAAALFREYFGFGTFWGIPVVGPFRLSGMAAPFFGFILAGFLLAGTRFLNKRLLAHAIKEREHREKRFPVAQEL